MGLQMGGGGRGYKGDNCEWKKYNKNKNRFNIMS